MKRQLKKICAAVVLLTLLYATARAQIQLGDITLSRSRPTIELRPDVHFRPGEGRAALRSLTFLRRIGGVAFGAVAKPRALSIRKLKLAYDRTAPDGQRVKAMINGKAYTVPVPDWILAPSIGIASSDDIALATAFGDYTDAAATDDERCDRYIFSFHSALRDNLLGLRVMQADLIGVLPTQYPDLPKDNGSYLLGALEAAPTPDELVARRTNQNKVFADAGPYQSYILTDDDVWFSIKGQNITFTGMPVYKLWRPKLYGQNPKTWVANYRARLEHKRPTRGWLLKRANSLIDEMAKHLRETSSRVEDPERKSVLDSNAAGIRLQEKTLSRVTREELLESLATLEWMSLSKEVEMLSPRENPLLDPKKIDASNHTIYFDMKTLSQTLAFFRYVRRNFPSSWRYFVSIAQPAQPIEAAVPTEVPKPASIRERCLASRG